MSLLDGIHLLVKAWNLVSGGTIENCYRKAGWAAIGQDIHHPNEPPPLYEELFQQISTSIPVHEFITVDDGVVSRATLSDVEIIASVKGSEVSEDEFQEYSDVEKVQDKVLQKKRTRQPLITEFFLIHSTYSETVVFHRADSFFIYSNMMYAQITSVLLTQSF